jgi:hypothetical protein
VLAHTLGATIVVYDTVQAGIPPLVADRGLLETALINLGTNARTPCPTVAR